MMKTNAHPCKPTFPASCEWSAVNLWAWGFNTARMKEQWNMGLSDSVLCPENPWEVWLISYGKINQNNSGSVLQGKQIAKTAQEKCLAKKKAKDTSLFFTYASLYLTDMTEIPQRTAPTTQCSLILSSKCVYGKQTNLWGGNWETWRDTQGSSASANFIQSSQKAPQTYPVSWSTKALWKLGEKTLEKASSNSSNCEGGSGAK